MNTRDYLDGNSFDGYKFFGAHKKEKGYIFRLLAPKADEVYLLGDFNNWEKSPMRKYATGVFSLSIDGAKEGDSYQYLIVNGEREVKKIDPFAKAIIYEEKSCLIVDESYKFKYKKKEAIPKNILQIHLGSLFKDKGKSEKEVFDAIIKHAKNNSYSSILLMPVNEYQNYKSLGYSSLNLFSYSRRYGKLTSLKRFIDLAHKANIQIIIEMDISEFDPDIYGLKDFDGNNLYNYPYEDILYNYFGQINFDITEGSCKSYIKSAIDYYLSDYKVDGIYFSSIENSIFWQGDDSRGVNKEWIEFIKDINTYIKAKKALALASFNGTYDMNLGFSEVFDNRSKTLINMMKDQPIRRDDYKKYINDLIRNENSDEILGFSYVDSYQNEANMPMKMYGNDNKFAQLKALYTFLYTLKNPKMLFMGDDSGNLKTFSAFDTFDFENIGEKIEGINDFYKEIVSLWTSQKTLSDSSSEVELLDSEGHSLYAYKKKIGKTMSLVVVNYTDIAYEIKSPYDLSEIFNTEDLKFGGDGNINGTLDRGDLIKIKGFSACVFNIRQSK